ncbi:hypothetical protein [Sandaracinus amylolyticus]|uniref:hypothetical protein n=1 Tax=Sandaracinus amylolyticus TaxID=927083 RepID=UPI001F216DF0|nr:hypothetical protein [Sandaracinus amylolyticus]UJR80688.1 Hypothetical protein I5071_27370 [Sandaracinus amylolyticus]
MSLRARAAALVALFGCVGCGTVDLGDNIVPPDLMLDEDFFYCRIQPEVIEPQGCAGGGAGEMGMCHTARSALRLVDTTGIAPPTCADDRVEGTVPAEYVENFQAVQFTVQSDPLSSPFYRRPTGLDSHPRVIFPESSPEADLIAMWIARGGL